MSTPKADQDQEDSLVSPSYILPHMILTQLKSFIYSHKVVLFLDIDGPFLNFTLTRKKYNQERNFKYLKRITKIY